MWASRFDARDAEDAAGGGAADHGVVGPLRVQQDAAALSSAGQASTQQQPLQQQRQCARRLHQCSAPQQAQHSAAPCQCMAWHLRRLRNASLPCQVHSYRLELCLLTKQCSCRQKAKGDASVHSMQLRCTRQAWIMQLCWPAWQRCRSVKISCCSRGRFGIGHRRGKCAAGALALPDQPDFAAAADALVQAVSGSPHAPISRCSAHSAVFQ